MKKFLLIVFLLISTNAFSATNYKSNFTIEKFEKAKKNGETVVITAWAQYCGTCKKQKPILKQAKEDFENVLFLFIEHTKNKNLVKELNINHWSTIVVYKNNKKITSSVGLVDKDQIYSLIKKGI